MFIISKIAFLIVGTLLFILGIIGLYGAFKISKESSDLNFVLGQIIVPISLLIIGIFLLVQFYKKPKKDDKD